MQLNFADKDEELHYLREAVRHVITGQGRETSDQSMSLDWGWDMLEDYYKQVLAVE